MKRVFSGLRRFGKSKDNKEWNSSLEYTAKELLNLFIVRLSLLAEKAADEATERYEHIRGADYGNGLEHGFESGAEWIVEELKRSEA